MSDGSQRILLVDDDSLFTEVMARGLRRRGFATHVCGDAASALADCARFRPSHIVLDLNMPGASGLVILPELLALAPGAKLLVLTGYSSIATAVTAIQAGAVNYLCKPATLDEILQAFDGPDGIRDTLVPSEPISMDRLEWEHIQRVLAEHNHNVSATARALGMHRRTLQRKLQKRPVRK